MSNPPDKTIATHPPVSKPIDNNKISSSAPASNPISNQNSTPNSNPISTSSTTPTSNPISKPTSKPIPASKHGTIPNSKITPISKPISIPTSKPNSKPTPASKHSSIPNKGPKGSNDILNNPKFAMLANMMKGRGVPGAPKKRDNNNDKVKIEVDQKTPDQIIMNKPSIYKKKPKKVNFMGEISEDSDENENSIEISDNNNNNNNE